ncbi:MAG TPA: thioesterase family protein [Spirochaetota bacterium]|nr:thioesterase family protein [Spirochaetota bacterium]HOK91663.1 thioesterase family protein [Spirochaetota bacterium]HPP95963.1 thioesterase family protein [Spirochaetota bacterium]
MKGITEIKVRGYHLDIYGHVNNARYIEFLEEARWAIFDDSDVGISIMAKGLAFTVVNINVSYKNEARVNETLVIYTEPKTFGSKSVTLSQNAFRKSDGKPVIEAEVTFVLVDRNTGKAIALDDEIKNILLGVGNH